jgi:hypothetical protein
MQGSPRDLMADVALVTRRRVRVGLGMLVALGLWGFLLLVVWTLLRLMGVHAATPGRR